MDNLLPGGESMLGFGMTVSVAPLTTLVMSSATQNRAGAASGINNAISQTAALLAIAVSAPIFFASFRIALPNQMEAAGVSPSVVQQLREQQKLLGAINTDDPKGRDAIDLAFVDAFHLIALLAAGASTRGGSYCARDDQKSNSGHSQQRNGW